MVRSQPVTRAAAPPPQPVPVEHSSAYLLRKRKQLVSTCYNVIAHLAPGCWACSACRLAQLPLGARRLTNDPPLAAAATG